VERREGGSLASSSSSSSSRCGATTGASFSSAWGGGGGESAREVSGAGDKEELLSRVGDAELPSAGLDGDETWDATGSWGPVGVAGPVRDFGWSWVGRSGWTASREGR